MKKIILIVVLVISTIAFYFINKNLEIKKYQKENEVLMKNIHEDAPWAGEWESY